MVTKQKTTFIFDFDSTIFPEESLDEIINSQLENDPQADEKYEQIKAVCDLGMTGEISMAASLEQRLKIATPNKQTIARYVIRNKHRIDLDLQNVLKKIQANGHQVLVVSGGFEEWIVPLLAGIVPAENIHANQIIDSALPMSFDNILIRPKETIIKELAYKNALIGTQKIIIGDGATDLSVFEKGLVDYFVGAFFYTGETKRASVIKKATNLEQTIITSLDAFVAFLQQFA